MKNDNGFGKVQSIWYTNKMKLTVGGHYFDELEPELQMRN